MGLACQLPLAAGVIFSSLSHEPSCPPYMRGARLLQGSGTDRRGLLRDLNLWSGELCLRESCQLLVGLGNVQERPFGNWIAHLIRGAPSVLGASAPMRSLILTGRRCDLHDGQTFDTHTKFRSVNAVSSGLPQSSFLSVAQLSPFGKKLVALGNKVHHPLAFGISHRQGDQAGLRFQAAPVFGISLSVGRIRRHGVLYPSHPGVERMSQVYVPNKGPVSATFCEASPAPV
jgi:hypothetical protein